MAKPVLIELLELYPLKALNFLISRLSYRTGIWLGSKVGILFYYIAFPMRSESLRMISQAFPDKSLKERKKINKDFFIHFGKTLFEFMLFPYITKDRLRSIVKFENLEIIDKILSRKKGLVAVTGHLGNWEITAAAFSYTMGYPVYAYNRRLDNERLEKYVYNYRKKMGVYTLDRKREIRKGFRVLLREKQALCFLIDQNWAVGGIFVPFFDKPASTSTGAAFFAMKTGAPVLVITSYRDKNDNHVIVISNEIKYRKKFNADNLRYNTALFTKEIEKRIKEHSEQWLWFHNRWRTKPKEKD